jgi:signal recognition particle subunit SEC65
MGKHLRKLFSADQVKEVFARYLLREIAVNQASAMLKIRRRQFFKLLKVYRERPESFSLEYTRKAPPRKIDAKAEAKITQELKKEAEIIRDKRNPVRFYNYSYLREILEKKHKVRVSLPTIIRRVKKMGITNKGPSERLMTARS